MIQAQVDSNSRTGGVGALTIASGLAGATFAATGICDSLSTAMGHLGIGA